MTLLKLFLDRVEKDGPLTAIRYKDGSRWQSYRWSDVRQMVEGFAAGLSGLGVKKGDRVAIMADTSPEWFLSDLAIMGLGAVTVPIYPSLTAEDVRFILNDCGATTFIFDGIEQWDLWHSIKSECPSVKCAVIFNNETVPASGEYQTWTTILSLGRKSDCAFRDACSKISPEDTATIPYTSGTTGQPKGVVLTHAQLTSEIVDVFSLMPVNQKDITLTFLPFSHILGRVEAWGSLYAGYALGFAESIERIRNNLMEIKPTFLVAVPRIFEKLYASVQAQLENQTWKKKLFRLALETGMEVNAYRQRGEAVPFSLLLRLRAYDKLVFQKVREHLGGHLRFAVSGGAPLATEVSEFFFAAGVPLYQGYGLTETTAGVTFNHPAKYRIGTVGPALADVELRLAADGEVLVRSQKVMKEYYNNPEATAEVFEDGFFKTGDIGEIDKDGFLMITDRKKDLIKTAGGKYIAPQRLEGLLKMNTYVSQALIHGDARKYVVALVTLNEPEVLRYAREHDLPFEDYKALTQSAPVQELIRTIVAGANAQLAHHETIKKFAVLDHDFSVESGEITPSLKLKRKFCETKYREVLDSLY